MHCNISHAYHNLIRLDKYEYMFCNATCTCVLNIIWSCDFHYEESFLVCIVNTIVSCVDDTCFDTICHMLIVCQLSALYKRSLFISMIRVFGVSGYILIRCS